MPKLASKNQEPRTKNQTVRKPVVKSTGLNLSVYTLDGTKKGTVALSKEIFAVKPSEKLMAQAIRVYLVNQRQGNASTKTRGEVSLTTAKWYRQKGTGRARHGAKSAPIFVGGGVAFGPRPRIFDLKMSKAMRRKALFSALSQKLSTEKVFAVDAASASKTKEVFGFFSKLNMLGKNKKANKVLFVANAQNAVKAVRNIGGTNIVPAHALNTYEVLNSNFVVFEKGSIAKMEETFLGKGAASAQ